MLSKRYDSTEFNRRTLLHVPSGTHLSFACAELCDAFNFLVEILYMKFDGLLDLLQIVGISEGTNLAPLLYCFKIQAIRLHSLFNETSRKININYIKIIGHSYYVP